jgi:choline kinase
MRSIRQAGLEEIWVSTGHNAQAFEQVHIPTVFNANFRSDNVLGTFFESSRIWVPGAICCFADILFLPHIIRDLVQSRARIALAVDPFWNDRYKHNWEDIATAEFVCAVDHKVTGMITGLPDRNCVGEALGIFKIEAAVGPKIYQLLRNRIHANPKVRGEPLPYLFNSLVEERFPMEAIPCLTPWHEIDTPADLERVPGAFLDAK